MDNLLIFFENDISLLKFINSNSDDAVLSSDVRAEQSYCKFDM